MCSVAQLCRAHRNPKDCKPTKFLWPRGFSRREYWSESPCPPLGDLLKQVMEPRSPAFQADSLPEPPGKPKNTEVGSVSLLQGIFASQG